MTATRFTDAPIPLFDKISETEKGKAGFMTDAWVNWFNQILQKLGSAAVVVASSGPLTLQGATIPATDVTGGVLPGGLYRVSYYAQITRAAGAASSLDITIDYQNGGVTQSNVGATVNGNTTATHQSADFFIRMDPASPIRYGIVYASAGVPTMQYSFDLLVEELGR